MGLLLIAAAQRVETRYESALADVGLSLPKLGVLKHLVEAGEALPLGRLAERMACVKSNITQLVDRLESEGLVTRVSDASDRRCVRAEITGEGRERFERGADVISAVEDDLFGDLAPEERAPLMTFLIAFGWPCGS